MRFASLLVFLIVNSTVYADLPSPRLDRITPLGASLGSTVEIEVAGADIEKATKLIFDHKGITAEHLKERKFKVTIAADVPAGTYDCRLIGKYGITNPRLFAVSRGLTEIAEKSPNDHRATAQQVPVNCAINGSSKQGREAVYRFTAKKGQRIVAECFAQRLDSPLDANLLLADADGKQLASNGDYAGKDPLVEFIAPKDGDYFVTINDLSFRGGFPYRLVITDQPHVENLFPRVVSAGQDSDLKRRNALPLNGNKSEFIQANADFCAISNLNQELSYVLPSIFCQRSWRPYTASLFALPEELLAKNEGQKMSVSVFGRNLGKGAKPSPWTINDLPLDAIQETVTPPADILQRGEFRFTDHPTGHSVLPTAATCTLHGQGFQGISWFLKYDLDACYG